MVKLKEPVDELKEEMGLSDEMIIELLNERIDECANQLAEATTAEEVDRAEQHIITLGKMRSGYLKYTEETEFNSDGRARSLSVVVPAPMAESVAWAFFSAQGYKLSMELMEYMFSNTDTSTVYKQPTYWGRVMSSKKIYSIANENIADSSKANNQIYFENAGNRNERDLYYSLRHCPYRKPSASSKTVILYDTYNFGDKDKNDVYVNNKTYFYGHCFYQSLFGFKNLELLCCKTSNCDFAMLLSCMRRSLCGIFCSIKMALYYIFYHKPRYKPSVGMIIFKSYDIFYAHFWTEFRDFME
jgi:hypothetical protein